MKSKVPAIVAGVYLALVALAVVALLALDDAQVSVYLAALTFPWSWGLSAAIDAIDPTVFDNAAMGIVISLIGAAINAAILYVAAALTVTAFANRA